MNYYALSNIVYIIIAVCGCFLTFCLLKEIKLAIISGKLIEEPSDDLVCKYYKVLKTMIISNYPWKWQKLRNTFFTVYYSSDVSMKNKEDLYNLLLRKGCHISNFNIDKQRKIKESIRKSGEEGEKKVAYNLGWLPSEYRFFKNIKLNSSREVQEFDNIVIGPNGIFHIETKNYGGSHGCKIKITNDGSWIKIVNETEVGMDSPEFQMLRHSEVLKENLDRNFGSDSYKPVGIIVLSNEKTIIEGAENSEIPVIKADRLVKYICNYNQNQILSEYEIQKLYNKINLCRIE